MTPAGIEPAPFRFVTQHLNHCDNAVPYTGKVNKKNVRLLPDTDIGNEGRIIGRYVTPFGKVHQCQWGGGG